MHCGTMVLRCRILQKSRWDRSSACLATKIERQPRSIYTLLARENAMQWASWMMVSKLFHTRIHTQGSVHRRSLCPIVHPITNSTTNPNSSSERVLHFSIRYHFYRQPRQQVTVACCAMNTGCPFIWVCFGNKKVISKASIIFHKHCNLFHSYTLKEKHDEMQKFQCIKKSFIKRSFR